MKWGVGVKVTGMLLSRVVEKSLTEEVTFEMRE